MVKRILKIFILMAFILVNSLYCYAEDYSLTAEVDENGMLIVEASTEELEGTKFSWMIVKPNKYIADVEKDNVATEETSAQNTIHYMDTSVVDKDQNIEFFYLFDKNSKSGKYLVRVKIHGEDSVRECEVYYVNPEGAKLALDELKKGTSVEDVLSNYIGDIDAFVAEKYDSYNKEQKEYIADELKKKNPETVEELKENVINSAEKIEIVMNMKNASKTEFKKMFEDNLLKLNIDSSSNYKTYQNMSNGKKEKVIVSLFESIGKINTPDGLIDNFEKSVDKINAEKETVKTNGGGGGGGSGVSVGGITVTPNKNEIVIDDKEKSGKFTDMSEAVWAEAAVKILNENGIINGVGENQFKPNDFITREAFVKIIVKAFEFEMQGNTISFDDVPDDAWYAEAVKIASSCGIIKGIDENNFGTGKNITRQDMAVIIYRACEFAGVGVYTVDMNANFNDMDAVSDYAKDSVLKMAKAKYINGKGNGKFDPENNLTRAEAAQIVYNVLFK